MGTRMKPAPRGAPGTGAAPWTHLLSLCSLLSAHCMPPTCWALGTQLAPEGPTLLSGGHSLVGDMDSRGQFQDRVSSATGGRPGAPGSTEWGTWAAAQGMGWAPGLSRARRWGHGETRTEEQEARGGEVTTTVCSRAGATILNTGWAGGWGARGSGGLLTRKTERLVSPSQEGLPTAPSSASAFVCHYLNPAACVLPLPNISASLGPFVILF